MLYSMTLRDSMMKGTLRHVIILEQKMYLTKTKGPVKCNFLRISCHSEKKSKKNRIKNRPLFHLKEL